MAPNPRTQIRWGFAVALAAILLVAILAFVPDPFFRYKRVTTTLDDVSGVSAGAPVYFRGATIGQVRSVDLLPATRTFRVALDVAKRWQPSACSYVSVGASNPLAAPRIELVAVEQPARACAAALAAVDCAPLAAARGEGLPITGCRRAPDLFQAATAAIGEAASVARTANQMAMRLQAMIAGDGSAGGAASAVDMAGVAKNATGTLAALNSLSTQLDRNFAPGRGDIALTLANVRRMTGRASDIDVASLNGILAETRTLVAQNQASIQSLLAQGSASAGQARGMLQDVSASLTSTSANLARVSDSLGTITDRAAADPTFVIRGQKLADPPPPGGRTSSNASGGTKP